ncbi:MAG TPA: hypothetical protein PKZ78_09080, partial [Candidatus Goldiibacteriota bacterium]|nr:hypothetical protein [Candidatus Goldiibacteriota bacterium]
SMYVRALRAIFNGAISNGDISSKIYPFGKEKTKYKVSSVRKVKKTLKQSDLKKLFEATGSPEQERARDFFFFSYNCFNSCRGGKRLDIPAYCCCRHIRKYYGNYLYRRRDSVD